MTLACPVAVVRREAAPGNVIEGLERVIAQLPSPLLLLEPATGRVRLANPTAIEHLGLVRKDVMGQPFADALAPTATLILVGDPDQLVSVSAGSTTGPPKGTAG